VSEANNTVRNTLTLEVGQFDKALGESVKKLGALDNKLDKTAQEVAQLEKTLSGLNTNLGSLTTKFGLLDKSLGSQLLKMNGLNNITGNAAKSTKKLADGTKQLHKETQKAAEQTDKLGQFTKRYDDKLAKLGKTTKDATKATAELKTNVNELGRAQSTASKNALKSSEKSLQKTLANNEKELKNHKQSLREISLLKREAEQKVAKAQQEYNSRYFGRNANSKSPQAAAMRDNIAQSKKELAGVTAVHEKVAKVVGGIQAQNLKLKDGVDLVNRQNQSLQAQAALKTRLTAMQEAHNKSLAEQNRLQQEQIKHTRNFVGPTAYDKMSFGQRREAEKAMSKAYLNSSGFTGPHTPTAAQLAQQKFYAQRANFVGPLTYAQTPRQQIQATLAQQRQQYAASPNFMGPLPATKAQQQQQAYYQNSKNFVGPYPSNHPNSILSYGAQQSLLAQQQRQQQTMHNAQMQNLAQQQRQQQAMHREQMTFAKELAAMYAGMKMTQASGATVRQMSKLEQAQSRVKLWNLSQGEEDEFFSKADALAKQEKYLSRAEATQIRNDAMSAIGYNNVGIMDKTITSAARNVHVLRAAGFENGEQSDLMKNMYGFAEARQVMYDPEEVIKSFDVLRRLATVSGGKIKVADIETVARNMGDLRQSVSAEGWLSVGALAEQFKTAGGGNGGGGGVATVGTMLKMMALYGSGRTITNRAADQLLGADILNVFDGDAAESYNKNKNANKQFQKMIKNAGFKDVKSMSNDPVRFFGSLRGQVLDYMMAPKNFETFFGAGADKHTYNAKGQMVSSKGQIVDSKEQDQTENAAIKRYLATMGISNKAVDGLALMMNKAFIERAEHVRDSAIKSESEEEALKNVQNTFKGSVENLQGEAKKLAEAFSPLLPYLTQAVVGFTGLVNVLAQFVGDNPAAGAFLAVTVVGGGLILTLTSLIGKFSLLRGAMMGLRALSIGGAAAASLGAAATAATGATTAIGAAGAAAAATGGKFTTVGAAGAAGMGQAASATSRVIGVLGGLLKWAGWIGLAAMFGWVMGKWISDVTVGGLTIGERMQNLYLGIETGWRSMINNISVVWQTFLSSFNAQNDEVIAQTRQRKKEIAEYKESMRIKPTYEKYNDNAQKVGADQWALTKGKKAGDTITRNGKPYKLTQLDINAGNKFGALSQADQKSYDYVDKNRYLKSPTITINRGGDGGLAADMVRNFNKNRNNYSYSGDKKSDTPTPVLDNAPTNTALNNPTPSHLADYSNTPAATGGGGAAPKERAPKQEREWNNPFYASIQDIDARTLKSFRTDEELGGTPDYTAIAKAEFKRKWAGGDFDPNNDPRSRMFTAGKYDKASGGWTTDQIDWAGKDATGFSVQDWLDKEAKRLRLDDIAKGVKQAAERVGATRETLAMSLENYDAGIDVDSSQGAALKRQFARQEIKTPAVKEHDYYEKYKLEALTNQATIDFANFALDTKKYNEQLQIELSDNEVDKRRKTAQLVYDEEMKKIKGIRDLLDEQIAKYEAAGKTEEEAYKQAVAAKLKMEEDFTFRIQLENEKRVKAQETATQRMMRQYGDLGTSLENIGADWTKQAMDTGKKLLTGQMDWSDLDWKQIGADVAADFAGSFFDKFMSDMYESMMGDTNFFDLFKQMTGGDTGWFAKLGGMFGIGGETPVATEGDGTAAAVNETASAFGTLKDKLGGVSGGMGGFWDSIKQTTSSLWQLAGDAITKAISALASWVTSLMTSQAASGGSSTLSSIGSLVSLGASMFGGGGADMSSFGSVLAETGGSASAGFGSSPGLQFAKGGAFTNGLYDSPTPFMFANGGTFGNLGVMGEAGPEAVMPLTRDSSGRLGVAASGMGGSADMTSNMVNITINVQQDGSGSESSSSGTQSEWKQMAQSVRAVVVDELARQSRPGGINYKK